MGELLELLLGEVRFEPHEQLSFLKANVLGEILAEGVQLAQSGLLFDRGGLDSDREMLTRQSRGAVPVDVAEAAPLRQQDVLLEAKMLRSTSAPKLEKLLCRLMGILGTAQTQGHRKGLMVVTRERN